MSDVDTARTPASERKRAILRMAERHLCPQRVSFWEESGIPLVIGRREGYFVWDVDGHRLYDLHLNGGTFNLGHRNPEIVESLVLAASRLDIGNHHFPSGPRAALASDLARLTPGDLEYSVFASGGSEAVDVAIKSARAATGRRRIVTLEHGYHGRTGLSGAAGEDGAARYFLSDHPDEFRKVPFGDSDAVVAALATGDVAAVLLETIPATYGFPIPDRGYLKAVRSLCTEYGALYVADEVQAGLGRTGDLWAVETFDIQPDILVTGKGFSGGMYPIAATVLTARAAEWLQLYGWGHVSTFGGSEIGCEVARTMLAITTRAETTDNVARLTRAFADGLASLARDDEYLVEIRQQGLVIGLRFAHPNGAAYVQRELFARGVWAIASGFDHAVLQWKPGLLFDVDLVGDVLDRLAGAMRAARDLDYDVPRRHRLQAEEHR